MIQEYCAITSCDQVAVNTYILSFRSPNIASQVQPGQFINIMVSPFPVPLLRRPFSVYHVDGDEISIIFNVVGIGTDILASKQSGSQVNIMGPLGCPFQTSGDYETAILVAGGLGVAPLPLLTSVLNNRNVVTFLGARTSKHIVRRHLVQVHIATDDGSEGFHGTIIDYLREQFTKQKFKKPKIFACGPNAMLKNLQQFVKEMNIGCEISLESVMACGIGICQGCPVERVGLEKKYSLICTQGTVFDSRTIILP